MAENEPTGNNDKPGGDQNPSPPAEQVVKVITTDDDPWRALVQELDKKVTSLSEQVTGLPAKLSSTLETLFTQNKDQSSQSKDPPKPPPSSPPADAAALPDQKTNPVKRQRRYL